MAEVDIHVYTSTIYVAVKECEEALEILDLVEDDTVINLDKVKKSWLRGILTDFLVLKLASIFDEKSETVSLKRLTHDYKRKLSNKIINRFEKKLSELEKENELLISKIKNNRHKRIAHIQKKSELGWTEKKIIDFLEKNGLIREGIKPVPDNLEFLTANNLPREDLRKLLKKIQDLIFYEIDYPNYLEHSSS